MTAPDLPADFPENPGLPAEPGRAAARVRFGLLLAGLAALLVAALTGVLPDLTEMAAASPPSGPLASFAVIGAVAVLLSALVPRSVLAAGAGLLFGATTGALYVMAGALVAAVLAFEIGRWLGRDYIRGRRRAAAVDSFLERRGITGVLVLRLLPIAPFGLVSYAFGATAVPRSAYLLATALGIAPSTIVFATLGAHALTPASPAFSLSTVAALGLAAAGVLGARAASRAQR